MKNILKISFLAAIVIGLASCLKDKGYETGATGLNVGSQTQKLIGLAFESGVVNNGSVALDFEDRVVTAVFVTVRLLSADVAPEDIRVTLDTTNMADLLPAGIVRLPNAFYTIPGGLTVTIPKGAREATLKIQTNAIQFDPSTTYGLGFRIKSVDPPGYTIASNFSTFYTVIGAKNQYDGVYSMVFSNYHPSANSGYTGETTTVHMITTGGNTNKMFWPLANAFAIPSILGGGFNYFGAQEPAYTVDPVTNKVTVVNTISGSVVYVLNSSFDSRYDPATKTYFVKFGYNNPGGVFNPASTREWTQMFTYTGPR